MPDIVTLLARINDLKNTLSKVNYKTADDLHPCWKTRKLLSDSYGELAECYGLQRDHKQEVLAYWEGYSINCMYLTELRLGYGSLESDKIDDPLVKCANAKDALILGLQYMSGRGVEPSDKLALYYFQEAALLGNADAQLNLGFMYSLGIGIKKDKKQAIEWLEKSASQGNANAMFELVRCIEEDGVKDVDKWVQWLLSAAQQGSVLAQYTLGTECGPDLLKMMSQNKNQAMQWMRKATIQIGGGSDCVGSLTKKYEDDNVFDLSQPISKQDILGCRYDFEEFKIEKAKEYLSELTASQSDNDFLLYTAAVINNKQEDYYHKNPNNYIKHLSTDQFTSQKNKIEAYMVFYQALTSPVRFSDLKCIILTPALNNESKARIYFELAKFNFDLFWGIVKTDIDNANQQTKEKNEPEIDDEKRNSIIQKNLKLHKEMINETILLFEKVHKDSSLYKEAKLTCYDLYRHLTPANENVNEESGVVDDVHKYLFGEQGHHFSYPQNFFAKIESKKRNFNQEVDLDSDKKKMRRFKQE